MEDAVDIGVWEQISSGDDRTLPLMDELVRWNILSHYCSFARNAT
jgi:hypothetical protein